MFAEQSKNNKVERILGIYTKLMDGDVVNKVEEAKKYGVDPRSIQRDIDDIRNFLELNAEKDGYINTILYNREKKGYFLEKITKMKFSNSEILAICKILLSSRAFVKSQMKQILDKLVSCCVPKYDQKMIDALIKNEEEHYIELKHKNEHIMNIMWEIGRAIKKCCYIEIKYQRQKENAVVTRKLQPVAILFSEYYFYLTAFIDDKEVKKDFDITNDSFPTIYRIDRIKEDVKVLNEHFHIPYRDRFEEGEFRKRIQLMYGGKLQRVKFLYLGENIDAVLDKLPTAQILSEKDGIYTICAEVFGQGIDMWLRSQGDRIKRLD